MPIRRSFQLLHELIASFVKCSFVIGEADDSKEFSMSLQTCGLSRVHVRSFNAYILPFFFTTWTVYRQAHRREKYQRLAAPASQPTLSSAPRHLPHQLRAFPWKASPPCFQRSSRHGAWITPLQTTVEPLQPPQLLVAEPRAPEPHGPQLRAVVVPALLRRQPLLLLL